MLTGLDESLLHQTSTTFADVATSDHRFYDRCWVAAYDPGGDMALNMGLGVYKNMDVADGFCCVVRGSHQRNVRVSRTLRPRLDDSVVGPLRYEVIDPYRHVRVDLEPDGHGVGCHLDWRATLPPFVEDPTLTEINGRVATNVQRYDQTGTVDGWISLDGDTRRRLVRSPGPLLGSARGCRGFEPATGSSPFADGFLVTWLLFRTPDLGGYVQLNRDGHGNETFKDGRLRFDDGRDDRVVCEVDQQVEFPSGSRWYRRASLQVTDDEGATYEMECERLSRPIVMRGAGYDGGFDDNQGLGVHRGNSVLEADAYDLSEDGHPRRLPDRTPMRSLQTEQPVSIVVNGSAGVGDLTVLAVGDLSRYGVPGAEGAAG